MWTSYEALCEMGANDDPTQVFGVFPAALVAQPQDDNTAKAQTVQEERGVLTPSFSLSQTPLDGTFVCLCLLVFASLYYNHTHNSPYTRLIYTISHSRSTGNTNHCYIFSST